VADEQGPFRNRIVGQGIKPADQFLANERNTRRHGQLQRSVIHDLLEQLGWVDVVKVNVRSSELWPEQDRHVETLVDGHERIWQALQANNADVPYIEVDLTPAEEALMLTSFDASGALADLDAVAFEDVLRDVDTGSAAIQEMLAQMAEAAGIAVMPTPYDEAFDQEMSDLDGLQDESIEIIVPTKYVQEVTAWLANGEGTTKPALGRGVMRRCGLL